MNIVTIWNYLSDTKRLISQSNAIGGKLPAYCTTIEPPEIPAGKEAFFDEENQSWYLQNMTTADSLPQKIKVYGYMPDTLVYIGSADAMADAMPANCTTVAPDTAPPAGYVLTFDIVSSTWLNTEDHRGETVWNTTDATAIYITAPGPYPAGSTTQSPDGVPYPVWDGSQWVTDTDQQQRANIRANISIYNDLMQSVVRAQCPLVSAVSMAISLDEHEQEILTALQQYAVTLAQFIKSADLTQTPLVFPEAQPGVLEYPVTLNSSY